MSHEPLKNFVFVFTGEMKMDREVAKGKILVLGARTTAAVSSKTTHLVCGDEPGPSKLSKAEELGIKILNEQEFYDLIDKHSVELNRHISTKVENSSPAVSNNEEVLPWVEKYRPTSMNDIIGNNSCIAQLSDFLDGKSEFKAALLSGTPGTGKTTSALVVCKSKGFYPVEFNASDLRSKSALTSTISSLLQNNTLGNSLSLVKKVLIMDEVDGMTSDRGGIPELVALIKKTKIPIICICNDKTHQKMRTLANYCLDLHFRKLDARTILPRIKEILNKEGRNLSEGVINEIIMNSNGDLRYILNTVQNLVSKDQINLEFLSKSLVKKNALKGIFEVVSEAFQKKSIDDKVDLYFEDYSLVPLFIQENYLKCTFKSLKELLQSAEALSSSEIVDSRIHGSEQEWNLMPLHAIQSVVLPTRDKTLQKRIDFPSYLGQYSKMQKNSRLLGEICYHLKHKMPKRQFRIYGAEILYKKFMKELSIGNIESCIKILIDLDLIKEDVINIGDIMGIDLLKAVPTKTKTALTRECKKVVRVLPYNVYSEAKQDDEDSE